MNLASIKRAHTVFFRIVASEAKSKEVTDGKLDLLRSYFSNLGVAQSQVQDQSQSWLLEQQQKCYLASEGMGEGKNASISHALSNSPPIHLFHF